MANIHWIMEKAREFQKNIYFCFIDYAKAFDCVDLFEGLVHFYQALRESPQGRALLAASLFPLNLGPGQKCLINSVGGRAPYSYPSTCPGCICKNPREGFQFRNMFFQV